MKNAPTRPGILDFIRGNINSFIVCASTASSVISLLAAVLFHWFLMDEEQMLYIFSAMAQTIGALLGLTLTAYTFFITTFTPDESEEEALSSLRKEYYFIVIKLSAITGLTIMFSVFGIVCLNTLPRFPLSFIINESVTLFLTGCASILMFAILILDPDKLKSEVQKSGKEAGNILLHTLRDSGDIPENEEKKSDAGNMQRFLSAYNRLYDTIILFPEKLHTDYSFSGSISAQSRTRDNRFANRFQQAIGILQKYQILSASRVAEIQEIRRFRNGLVHGLDFHVPTGVSEKTEEICQELMDMYKEYGNEDEDAKADTVC